MNYKNPRNVRISVNELEIEIEKLNNYIKNTHKYSFQIVTRYSGRFRMLLEFLKIEGVEYYESKIGQKFLKERIGHLEWAKMNRTARFDVQSIRNIEEFILDQELSYSNMLPFEERFKFPDKYDRVFKEYITYRKKEEFIAKGTELATFRHLRTFGKGWEKEGLEKIQDIKLRFIYDYLINQSINSNELSQLRSFLKFLYLKGYISNNLSEEIPVYREVKESVLPSVYTSKELGQVLKSIDRRTPLGKRDYCILLIAITYGYRAGDISGLRWSNIHWDSEEIHLTTEKNIRENKKKLLPNIGNAILDYWNNGRPEVDNDFLFIIHKAPYRRLESSSITSMTRKRFTRSGVNIGDRKSGPHVFRFSLATDSLERGVPINIISEILVHGSYNSTKIYTRLDMKSLSNCMLKVSPIDNKFYSKFYGIFEI